MPHALPDHRYRLVEALANTGGDARAPSRDERALYEHLSNGTPLPSNVEGALVQYRDREFRHVLDALLLAHGDDEVITDMLHFDAGVVETYRALFFDASVFGDDEERAAYVAALDVDAGTRQMYRLALVHGATWLASRLRVPAIAHVREFESHADVLPTS